MRRTVLLTVASFLAGRVLERVIADGLGSKRGRRLMQGWDTRTITPFEHRALVQRWAGRIAKAVVAVGPVLAVVGNLNRAQSLEKDAVEEQNSPHWTQLTSRAAELVLAVGAILKVVSDYLEEREQVEAEHGG